MSFWEQAFGWGWVTAEQLRQVVITPEMPMGELTEEEFKRITGEDFKPVAPPIPEVMSDPPAEPATTPEPAPKKK